MESLRKMNHLMGTVIETLNSEEASQENIEETANMTVREGAFYYLGLGKLLLEKSDEDPEFGDSYFVEVLEKLMKGEIILEEEPE